MPKRCCIFETCHCESPKVPLLPTEKPAEKKKKKTFEEVKFWEVPCRMRGVLHGIYIGIHERLILMGINQ